MLLFCHWKLPSSYNKRSLLTEKMFIVMSCFSEATSLNDSINDNLISRLQCQLLSVHCTNGFVMSFMPLLSLTNKDLCSFISLSYDFHWVCMYFPTIINMENGNNVSAFEN